MVNHTRTGKAFSHNLRVEPLRDSRGNCQCFQATSSNIEFLNASLQASMQMSSAAAPADPSLDASTSPLPGLGADGALQTDLPIDLRLPVPPPAEATSPGGFSPTASPSLKAMCRIGSDLKISEMLDLFDTSRAAAPSPALSSLAAPIPGEAEWQ